MARRWVLVDSLRALDRPTGSRGQIDSAGPPFEADPEAGPLRKSSPPEGDPDRRSGPGRAASQRPKSDGQRSATAPRGPARSAGRRRCDAARAPRADGDVVGGNAIPGTAARSRGPRRDRLVLDASDLPLATGVRLGELLTVRRADCVPIDKGRWRIRVTGTIVTDKETGKLYRKPKPKTKNSVGSIVVADFAVATLERLLAAAGEDTEAMLFTNRDGGSHGVTPRTFRKTVTTRVK